MNEQINYSVLLSQLRQRLGLSIALFAKTIGFSYFILGMSSFWCFGWKGLLADSGISFLDQGFKGVIPIRHFDWSDLPYDMAGYMIGCFVGWLIKKIMEEFKKCISRGNIVG